jgi:hypothetical protein
MLARDVPIPKGRKLRVRVVIDYEIEIDDDFLAGEQAATGTQILEWMEAGKYESSDAIANFLRRSYDHTVSEHMLYLVPLETDRKDDGSISEHARIEMEWERKARESGAPEEWFERNRVYVDLEGKPVA